MIQSETLAFASRCEHTFLTPPALCTEPAACIRDSSNCIMAEAEISLRPRALRPGGGASLNPFAQFGKGAAPTRAAKVRDRSIPPMPLRAWVRKRCRQARPRSDSSDESGL
jgi:hypothetical protein